MAAGTQPLRAHELASTRAAQGGRRGALAHPVCLLARRKPENEAAAGTPVLTCPLWGFFGACCQHGQGAAFSCLAAQVFLLDARDNPGCLTFPKVPREWHGLRLESPSPNSPAVQMGPGAPREGRPRLPDSQRGQGEAVRGETGFGGGGVTGGLASLTRASEWLSGSLCPDPRGIRFSSLVTGSSF